MSDFNETVVLQHSIAGAVAVATGVATFALPFPAELVGVSLAAGTGPVGADLIIDVNKNGTTIFTDQATRPKIAAGQTASVVKNKPALAAGTNYIYTPYPSAKSLGVFAEGDKITVDVDAVGSTTAGSNLGILLVVQKA